MLGPQFRFLTLKVSLEQSVEIFALGTVFNGLNLRQVLGEISVRDSQVRKQLAKIFPGRKPSHDFSEAVQTAGESHKVVVIQDEEYVVLERRIAFAKLGLIVNVMPRLGFPAQSQRFQSACNADFFGGKFQRIFDATNREIDLTGS